MTVWICPRFFVLNFLKWWDKSKEDEEESSGFDVTGNIAHCSWYTDAVATFLFLYKFYGVLLRKLLFQNFL